MRNNQPVTTHEIVMKDGTTIMSRTDINGRIQYINKEFAEISGFTKEELIGQPHNIVRHPDMPTEAFADLWRDIKNGLAWNGYVKNRTKGGDYYWVQANTFPAIENGQITGFISVRSKPDAEAVKAVEPIYKQFQEGKAEGLSIVHGQVISHDRKARFARWFERINNKMLCSATILCLMVTLVGFTGIYVVKTITRLLDDIYHERTLPMKQLQSIGQLNYDVRVALYEASFKKEAPQATAKAIREKLIESSKLWNHFIAHPTTDKEKVLLGEFTEKEKALKTAVITPALDLLAEGHYDELGALLAKSGSYYTAQSQIVDALIDSKVELVERDFNIGIEKSRIGFAITAFAILLAIVVAQVSAKLLRRTLSNRLGYLDTCLNDIMAGDYTKGIDSGNDELHGILTTVRALQGKLAFTLFEKQEAENEKLAMQEKLAADFENSVKGIVNLVSAAATELSQTANGMVTTVADSVQKTTEASNAAGGTASNVQTVATAAEELSASVREISSQLQKTTQLVIQSQEKTRNADTVVSELNRASEKVVAAMQMIGNISSQINLLALNATIESARAGEAGKGFAVVASEVKNLAGQTDKTIQEIQTVVEEMRSAALAITGSLSDITSSVGAITEASASVASAVEEQSAVTGEIARNMQHAASGTQIISNNLVEVMASSTHAGDASEQMLAATRDLSAQAENLNGQVDEFLKRIRGAA